MGVTGLGWGDLCASVAADVDGLKKGRLLVRVADGWGTGAL
jgi:hypothetical protein